MKNHTVHIVTAPEGPSRGLSETRKRQTDTVPSTLCSDDVPIPEHAKSCGKWMFRSVAVDTGIQRRTRSDINRPFINSVMVKNQTVPLFDEYFEEDNSHKWGFNPKPSRTLWPAPMLCSPTYADLKMGRFIEEVV